MAQYKVQDPSFADTAPVRLEGETVADVSPEAVWAVLTDDERWPEWFGEPLKKVERTSAETGMGSTRRVTLGAGRGVSFDEEFIIWEPHTRWGFTGIAGPPIFRSLVERCTIHVEGPGRTRITYRMAIDPSPLGRVLMPALSIGVRRSLKQAMKNLAAEAAKRSGTESTEP